MKEKSLEQIIKDSEQEQAAFVDVDDMEPALDQYMAQGTKKQLPNYQWEADAKFELDGKTFEQMFNMLQDKIQQPQIQEAITIITLYEKFQAMFMAAVETGTIKDVNK